MNFNPNNVIIALNCASFVVYLLFSSCYGGPYSHYKIQNKLAGKEAIEEVQSQSKLRSEFLQVLRTRRPAQVPPTIEPAKPVENPLYQISPPTREEIEILESTPKADIDNLDELLEEENLYLNIEAYASRGYIAISVDSRYHGERATNTTTYIDVWDLIKLADYLTRRRDIDPSRIGINGISLGGIHAWFAAFADTSYAVAVPVIGIQGFRWAIDNDEFQGRVETIKPLFEVARDDLGKAAIDKDVVEKVWDRIAPGFASQFDSPYSIPAIAPRPLLILNANLELKHLLGCLGTLGAEDPQCPLGGLEIPRTKASKAYRMFNCSDNFKFIAEPGIRHQITRFQMKESADWFDMFFNP
ncbi:hypothetical protein JHK87_009267 [Glycine soja]|nr:hypothetical protein JHK87_009267 [Glycine soja]